MENTRMKKASVSSSTLAPGFRFHPTDEELVRYYLRRKICGKSLRIDAISEVDIYKVEPWDLPSMSRLKTRDLEWYFFSVLDKKYGNGAKTNRATEKGYWKTTGKDRAVYHKTEIVGMKKTLVYHSGRAPKGQRTNWVMHEYRLMDLELERVGIIQDAFVLCRVFQKSGSGPKNGEQYGAPFIDEEWEDEELEVILKEGATEEVDFGDDAYLVRNDLEQILVSDVPSDTVPLPLNFNSADGSFGEETAESVNDTQMTLVSAGKQHCEPEQRYHGNFYSLPVPYDTDVRLVKHEYMGESSKSRNPEDLDYLLSEPSLNASGNLRYGDGGFIEANDLLNPVTDASAFDLMEGYLAFFNADAAMLPGSDNLVSDQSLLPQKGLSEGTEQGTLPNGQVMDNNNNDNKDVALPSDNQDFAKYQPDFKYSFVKQPSQMWGGFPAPKSFAAEFPPKNAIRHTNSEAQSSSSVHVTAGMIQIRNMNVGVNGTDLSSGKHENLNIILSFGFARGDDGSTILESSVSILPGKTISIISRELLYFMFLWVLILSVSFKIRTSMCAN